MVDAGEGDVAVRIVEELEALVDVAQSDTCAFTFLEVRMVVVGRPEDFVECLAVVGIESGPVVGDGEMDVTFLGNDVDVDYHIVLRSVKAVGETVFDDGLQDEFDDLQAMEFLGIMDAEGEVIILQLFNQ